MEFKGTKGKWVVKKPFKIDGNVLIDIMTDSNECDKCNCKSSGYLIARTYKNAIAKKEQIPNALLISKAPEMLEMLVRIMKTYDKGAQTYLDCQQLIKEATEL